MHARAVSVLVVAGLAAAGGCGGSEPPAALPPQLAGAPPLARTPVEPGEILVRGETSPGTHGPFQLRGTYRARFEQYAPEDPALDF